jgi:pimeloyl-ACP methyl ester carboxylesterase
LRGDPHGCFRPGPNRTATEIAFIEQQYLKPYRYESVASENKNFIANRPGEDEDSREEAALARPFGDKPLVVLTAGKTEQKSWKEGHDRLAARSKRGESVIVPDAGHYIQIDDPEAVIAAVKKVVLTVRSEAR